MKLVDFSVTNYRSITKAHKISLQNLTVLVGKNNEGKSNLLTALNVSMRAMIYYSQNKQGLMSRRGYGMLYSWNRDFPVQFRERRSGLESIFRLNFCLENEESTVFTHETGIRSNEAIPIEIKIGKDNQIKITLPKRGSSSYTRKSAQVTSFICDRISFNYIQAVRTEGMALNILQDIISLELREIEGKPEFKKAMEVIDGLHQEVYNRIASRILSPLQEFLPQLASIQIENRKDKPINHSIRNDIDIILDDGTPTSIGYKGDGVKSLVSLAILKDVHTTNGASIIAIEEPESHLHPSAIHSLVNVVNSIAQNHQVIITTHNPLFVQRNNIKNNIIVNSGTAQPAKSIKEIRDILGVLPADNLINASHVLVVEGEDDKIALKKILSALSLKIKAALSKNILVVKPLSGASNLSYELSTLRSFMCKYFVFLDADEEGYSAAEKAIANGYITEADIKYCICNGQTQAEFEDCLNSSIYSTPIQEAFSVNINVPSFRGNGKWSDRLKNTFLSQGQRWSDKIEKKVKLLVAESIPDSIGNTLNEYKRGAIDALVTSLEAMLN